MFFLSKFLPLFVLPIGLFFVLLFIGGIQWRRQYNKSIPKVWVLAFLQLYLFATPWVAGHLIAQWELPPPSEQELASHKDEIHYAVVLGGVMEYTGYNFEPYQILDSGDRLMAGLRLINEGYADTLLFSGGQNPLIEEKRPSEADLMKEWVSYYTQLDTNIIRIDPHSVNTNGNAKHVSQLLNKQQKAPKIYLVTSAYHMRRASMVFKKWGLDPIPVSTDHRSAKQLHQSGVMNWIPSSSALHYSSEILREMLGYAYYKWII